MSRISYSCGVCGDAEHTITSCPKHATVARVRLEQALVEIDPNDWIIPWAPWSEVRERLDLVCDTIDVDVELALAVVDDVLERWPTAVAPSRTRNVLYPLAPAWKKMVVRAAMSLDRAAAEAR